MSKGERPTAKFGRSGDARQTARRVMNLMGLCKSSAPQVGMGATKFLWSDSHAYTITRVSASGKTFWMKQDDATRIDDNGMSDCQEYEYTPNENAREEMVRMTKRGWRCSWDKQRVVVGFRYEYYDYSF